jgi:hypothetical protein
MEIRYLNPLSRGWERMKKALFKPFDLKKWFVVGFTAFLAGLTDFGGGGRSSLGKRDHFDMDSLMEFPRTAREWLADNPGWTALILVAGVLIVVLVIVCTWLSSRGKFMFLDNVVHDRALVAAPWHEYRAEGNSLFLWRLVFGFAVLAVVLFAFVASFLSLYARYQEYGESEALIGPIVLMALGFLALMALLGLVWLFLTDFVVPIMYRHRVSAMRAWSVFLRLLSAYPLQFAGYSLLVLLLLFILVLIIVVGGLATCCIGFLILAIPYINQVLLLPISTTWRAFSVEFLEQFGPEYQIFPRSAPAQPTVTGQAP